VTLLRNLVRCPHLIQLGILLTFLLIPVWYRLPRSPFLSPLYVTRFLILLPVVWTIALWLLTGVPGLREFLRDARRTRWGLCFLLLGLWAYCSQSWAFVRINHPEVAATAALQFGLVVLFAVVVACTRPSLRAIIIVLAIGVMWNGVLTFAQTASQGPLGLRIFGEFGMTPDSPGASVVVAGDLRWLRPYALLPHPNMLGGFFVIGLLALVAWIISPEKRLRWIGTLLSLIGLWALLLTFSRGAWLGLAAGLFVLLPLLRSYLKPVWRHIIISGVLVVIVGITFALIYRPLLSARAGEGAESVELRSISDRTVYTYYALEAVYEEPVLGVGVGNFPWRSSHYLAQTDFDLRGDNVHHVMLSALAELGIIGLALLTATLVFGVEAVLYSVRSAPDARERAAFLAGVLALGIIGLLDHYPWTMFQMQLAWWSLLAAALGAGQKPEQTTDKQLIHQTEVETFS
jgi:O-antigen ligase